MVWELVSGALTAVQVPPLRRTSMVATVKNAAKQPVSADQKTFETGQVTRMAERVSQQ